MGLFITFLTTILAVWLIPAGLLAALFLWLTCGPETRHFLITDKFGLRFENIVKSLTGLDHTDEAIKIVVIIVAILWPLWIHKLAISYERGKENG